MFTAEGVIRGGTGLRIPVETGWAFGELFIVVVHT